MSQSHHSPKEDEGIARTYSPNRLHDLGNGYFGVVLENEQGFDLQLSTRILLKFRYLIEKDDIEGLRITKINRDKEVQHLDINTFDFRQLRALLKFISTTNLGAIPQKTISLANNDEISDETTEKIKLLLSREGGEQLIQSLLDEGIITSVDIVNTGYRKQQLNIFQEMLTIPEAWKDYAARENVSDFHEEKVWQHFFSRNGWIFGYGLNYRFEGILQKEFYASEIQADGSEGVITDFLLADSRFTTFVEIKRPSTPLFGTVQNRSKSWRLSNDLIDSVSQILEQKASGQHRFEKGLFTAEGKKITQSAYDPKVILIIGDWNSVSAKNDLEKEIKEKTFELYRRDSRNIQIITYDELLERAKFIVAHKVP